MSLLPVDTNCTPLGYTSSNVPKCTAERVHNTTLYPSWINCRGVKDDPKYCYVVFNGGNTTQANSYGTDLHTALANCCWHTKHERSGLGFGDACTQFCEPQGDGLEEWNACLADYGYGPTYNDTGAIRDTYCVKGDDIEMKDLSETVKNGGNVVGGKSAASSKAGLAIGALFLSCALL